MVGVRKVVRLGLFLRFASTVFVDAFSLSSPPTTEQQQWKPKVASLEERRILRGKNHDQEKIGTIGFHHVEFYCGDAKSMAGRFALALGMKVVGETGQFTGNAQCVSYGLVSGNFRVLLTAPYSTEAPSSAGDTSGVEASAPNPLPSFSLHEAHSFFRKHGLAAKAVGIEVKDARESFKASMKAGAKSILEPTYLPACKGQTDNTGPTSSANGCYIAEVELYGDVALRYISYEEESSSSSPPSLFLPHLAPREATMQETYGIEKIDHAVGNVPNLLKTLNRVASFTGFHEFAEFTAEDVGTVDSGLNSVVLASDSEHVLLPLNEPTQGKRKSQIQTYLEQNEGAGLQHLALKTNDIVSTIRKMKAAEASFVGFELMKRPSDAYYRELPKRLGDKLTKEKYAELEELGILADADDEGVLLQIFTKPIGDRPTFFFEVIERIGCQYNEEESGELLERPGCGGFGQGNFRELFKAIEEHEKTLKV